MCSGLVVRIHYCQGVLACLKLCTVIHQNAQNPLRLYRNMTGIHYIVLLEKFSSVAWMEKILKLGYFFTEIKGFSYLELLPN